MKSLAGEPKRKQHLHGETLESDREQAPCNSLDDIIPELVEKKRWSVRTQVLRDQCNLLRRLNALDYLLCSPCTVFVDANHGEMRAEPFKHGQSWGRRAFLEQLLHHLERYVSISAALPRSARLTVLPSQSEAKSTISPSRNSEAVVSTSSTVMVFESMRLRSSLSLEASQRLVLGLSDTSGMVV
jgi:hypothetical protein